jgi:hypothetical protein
VCLIFDGDDRLEPARTAWKRLGVDKECARLLDPHGQAKWWYFFRGKIPPERFQVQFRGRAGYVDVSPEAMARILPVLDVERAKYEICTPLHEPGVLAIGSKDPTYNDLWLLFESFPAERFQLVPKKP